MWEAWTLAALALLAWLWFDSMRAREHAVAAGARACERNGLQFLDQFAQRATRTGTSPCGASTDSNSPTTATTGAAAASSRWAAR